MTTFGWDTSHYDDINGLGVAVMRRAMSEGIAFVTAKVGEAGKYDDPADAGTLTAARDAGIRVLGGYYVPRTPSMVGVSIAAQVEHCLALADAQLPWWRTFDGWFWQTDLERWPYDPVSAADGIEFGERIEAASARRSVLYASKGQYGNQLTKWRGLLWNANYPTGRRAPFKDLYPGDDGVGWAPYSGHPDGADFWQYASSATIAGKTTCDANAYRGTLPQLIALLTPPGAAVTAPTAEQNANELMHGLDPDGKGWTGIKGVTAGTHLGGGATAAGKAASSSAANTVTLADVVARLEALDEKVSALTGGGGGGSVVDLAAMRAVIREETIAALNATRLTTGPAVPPIE